MRTSILSILFTLISCFINLSSSTLFNGFQIRDLYTNDATFIADAEQWTPTALRRGIPYNLCNGVYIVGGHDVLGYPDSILGVQGYNFQKTYENLPDHDIIYFTISLWLIDSWDYDPPDTFQLQFDSVLLQGWTFDFGNFTGSVCGNSDFADLANMTLYGRVSHTGSSLTLRVISQMNSYALDESLGFRDVNLIFAESIEINVAELCGLSSIPLPTNQCSCSFGEYFDIVSIFDCVACDASCRSCFGPTSQDCYECQTGYSYVETECIKCDENCAACSGFNENQCADCLVGKSLFNNEVCIANCVSTSFVSQTILTCDSPCPIGEFYDFDSQICVNPCEINGGFLYWDGTCNSLCPFPLTDDGLSRCVFSCEVDEFLYWDGLCNKTCESPFVLNLYKNRLFCQHPCETETDYIYWNGTCGNDCPSPNLNWTDGRVNYCDLPCEEGQFLSSNLTCLDSCKAPFKIREQDGINYCEFPCQNSGDYLYWNGSCLGSCPSPHKASSWGHDMNFCSFLCEQYGDYYYPVDGECLPKCDPPFKPEIEIVDDQTWYAICVKKTMGKQPPGGDDEEEGPRGPFYFPITAIKIASERVVSVFIALDILVSLLRDSHVMILILTIKILNFMRYVDIRIPPQLVQEIRTFDHNYYYLNFGPGMSERMRGKFVKTSLPMVFERTGLHSRFLVNFFKPITSFLIMMGVIIMIGILQRLLRKKNYQQHILMKMVLRRIEIFLKWNMVMLLVICNVDEITLYGVFEWKTVSTDSAQDFISLLVSISTAVLSLIVCITPFYLLHKIYRTRFKVLSNQANEPYFNLLKKIEGFQLLWKDFKDSSGPQKCFLPLYILRIALVYMIIGLLHTKPMLQMVLIFLVSLGMLAYMSIVKPFMKILDFIQSVIYEVCMLLSIGSLLILSIFDFNRARADQVWIFLGDCIMFCHIFISFTAVLCFIIKFFLELRRVWAFSKTVPKPVSLTEFAILFLKEDDPIIQELKKNKRTSRRLDLTNLEREIETRNFERFNIKFASEETSLSQTDEVQPSFIPRKGDLRIRRSLFGVKIPSSDSEGSPMKTTSTLDEIQSPSLVSIENVKLPKKIFSQTESRKISEEFCSGLLQAENPEKCVKIGDSESLLQSNKIYEERIPPKRKFFWKNLETIKELDSLEASDIKNGFQTKRLGSILQDPLREELSLLSAVNKRLSSETMMQKIEEIEILKEKVDLIKKKLTVKEDAFQEALFE